MLLNRSNLWYVIELLESPFMAQLAATLQF